MKILEFVRRFNEPTATFIYNEITELANMGHDVEVSCLSRLNEDRFPFDRVTEIPLHVLRRKINYGLSRLGLRMNFRNARFRDSFQALMQRFQPDVIHCHYGPDALFVIDNYDGADIPVFISFHGYDASSLLRKKIYRQRLHQVLSRPYVFPVFVTLYMREQVNRHGIPAGNSFVLYYGTDVSFFRRQSPPPPPDPFVFLQVSSFREKKGHAFTLEAFARLKREYPSVNTRLILAGDGPLLPRVKALCHSLGLDEWVSFTGQVTSAGARNLMEQAHAFVHHSIVASDGDMEGIPNALMEAMAMELPVISTRHSGIPELVEEGVNGYLVDERDVAAYTTAMRQILSWPLKPENREKITTQFERAHHAKTLTAHYLTAVTQLNIQQASSGPV